MWLWINRVRWAKLIEHKASLVPDGPFRLTGSEVLESQGRKEGPVVLKIQPKPNFAIIFAVHK